MMWILILLSVALVHGSSADSDCARDENGCTSPEMFDFVPREISEFNRLCPQMPAYIRCLKDFQDKCGTDESRVYESEEEFNSMYRLMSDFCEEGALLNTIATSNLICLNGTFSNTTCPEQVKAVTGPYRSPMGGDERHFTLPIELMCLQKILDSSCIAADIGKNCGEAALEATLEFLRRSLYIEQYCSKRYAQGTLKTLDMFNLNEQQRAVVVATLEKVLISAAD